MIWLKNNLSETDKAQLKKLAPFCRLNGYTEVTDSSYQYKGIKWGGADKHSHLELFKFDDLSDEIITDDAYDAKLLHHYLPRPDEDWDRYPYPEEWDDFFKGFDKEADGIAVTFDAYLEHFISDYNMLSAIKWEEVIEIKTGVKNNWPLGDWALDMNKLTDEEKHQLEKLNPYCLLIYPPENKNTTIQLNFLDLNSVSHKLSLFNFNELQDQNIDLIINDVDTAYGVIRNFYDHDSIYWMWDDFLRHLDGMDKNIHRIAIPLDGYISYFAMWYIEKEYFAMLRHIDWDEVKKLKSI